MNFISLFILSWISKFLLFLFAILPVLYHAQNFENGFNFVLPGDDTTSGSFLPDFPIMRIEHYVSINSEGHFSVDGTPIRFWGVNLTAEGAFPENKIASSIAGRLRKMGFNLVRFHHLDNSWSTGSLFEQGKDTRHLNPVTIDRFNYFLYELKKNGIYVNINLNVSRRFNALDGVPDSDSLQYNAMGVKVFDPQLIMLQKEFARQLLTHKNPYTGISIADDPVIALIEITNENSLYKGWQYGGTRHFSEGGLITWRHKVMLDTLFNSFLKRKYNTTLNLAATWNIGADSAKDIKGLLEVEAIENNSVKRIEYNNCKSFTDARVKDISEFYVILQNEFFDKMLSFLKDSLNVKVPIVGTNWNVGPGDLISQSRADYIDNHMYWQHPVFPNEMWSTTDWYIENTSMAKAEDGGTIADLFAGVAMTDKPYTISEYNHPFPNRYQSEMMIFTTAYSSFHNADGIMFYDYNNTTADWDSDVVNGFFGISRNHLLMSFMPSCAFAFRNSFISSALNILKISYTSEKVYLLPKEHESILEDISLFPKKLALIHGIKIKSFYENKTTDFTSFPAEPVNPYVTDTKEIIWNTDGLISVNTPGFVGISGLLKDFARTNVGVLQIMEASGFGTFTWLALNDNSLQESSRSLLTLSSTVQNSGMSWEGNTSVHNNWGTAPTQISPLLVKFELSLTADSIRVYPLDQYGNNNQDVFTTYLPNSRNKYEITLDQNSLKTLWFGIEQFGKTTDIKTDTYLNNTNFLKQNYPNPFNPITMINYTIPEISKSPLPTRQPSFRKGELDSFISLKVFDILGREVSTLVNEKQPPGEYQVKFDGRKLSSGVYMYVLRLFSHSGNNEEFIVSKKMILLK